MSQDPCFERPFPPSLAVELFPPDRVSCYDSRLSSIGIGIPCFWVAVSGTRLAINPVSLRGVFGELFVPFSLALAVQ